MYPTRSAPYANGDSGTYQFLDAWKDAYGYHDRSNADLHGWGLEQERKLKRRWQFWTYSLGPSLNYGDTGAVPGTPYDEITRYNATNGTKSIGLIYKLVHDCGFQMTDEISRIKI